MDLIVGLSPPSVRVHRIIVKTRLILKGLSNLNLQRPASGVQILIYDAEASKELVADLLERRLSFHVMDTRWNSINLWVAVGAIRQILRSRDHPFNCYVDSYIRLVKPALIVTLIDNDWRFWTIRSRNPEAITIAVQNGSRSRLFDLFSSSAPQNAELSYLFAFNPDVAEEYRKYGQIGNLVTHGSFRNNRIPIKHSKRDGVGWISQYSPDWTSSQISRDAFYRAEAQSFQLVALWARSRSLQMSVLLRSRGASQELEAGWFRSLLPGEDLSLMFPMEDLGSYGNVDRLQLVATCESSMGYEALARGTPCLFFNLRGIELGAPDLKFGWPRDLEPEGDFWTSSKEETLVFEKLDSLVSLSGNSACAIQKSAENFITFDKGNTKFFGALDEELSRLSCD